MLRDKLSFLRNHLMLAARVPCMEQRALDGFVIESFRREMFRPVTQLLTSLRGKPLSRRDRWLLRMVGPKLCYVAILPATQEPVGVTVFWINDRDHREHTVHLGFIGVVPHLRGRGVGFGMLKSAVENFAESKTLAGISSRVSLTNEASIRLHTRLGFQMREHYTDPKERAERAYLVCPF